LKINPKTYSCHPGARSGISQELYFHLACIFVDALRYKKILKQVQDDKLVLLISQRLLNLLFLPEPSGNIILCAVFFGIGENFLRITVFNQPAHV